MAIVEAASCGLLVISTNVGGVPEVLPDDMMMLAEPSFNGLFEATARALKVIHHTDTSNFHHRIEQMYNWEETAERTEVVYDHVRCFTSNVCVLLCMFWHVHLTDW
jgi:phosphatidylinositol glycan class A protein